MMVAMASAFVVPATERWGVLVTNLGATFISILGALYVQIYHLLISLSYHVNTPHPYLLRTRRYFGVPGYFPGIQLRADGIKIDCYRILWVTIQFGEELRAYVDVGYSSIADV